MCTKCAKLNDYYFDLKPRLKETKELKNDMSYFRSSKKYINIYVLFSSQGALKFRDKTSGWI